MTGAGVNCIVTVGFTYDNNNSTRLFACAKVLRKP